MAAGRVYPVVVTRIMAGAWRALAAAARWLSDPPLAVPNWAANGARRVRSPRRARSGVGEGAGGRAGRACTPRSPRRPLSSAVVARKGMARFGSRFTTGPTNARLGDCGRSSVNCSTADSIATANGQRTDSGPGLLIVGSAVCESERRASRLRRSSAPGSSRRGSRSLRRLSQGQRCCTRGPSGAGDRRRRV